MSKKTFGLISAAWLAFSASFLLAGDWRMAAAAAASGVVIAVLMVWLGDRIGVPFIRRGQ
jgi:uncharacterized membrane protein